MMDIRQEFHNILHDHQTYQHFHHFKYFAGLIPRDWNCLAQYQPTVTKTTNWATKLSWWLIQQGYDLWLLRNQQNNDKDELSPVHKRLNDEIAALYKYQHDILSHDRGLFAVPIEERY